MRKLVRGQGTRTKVRVKAPAASPKSEVPKRGVDEIVD